MRLGCHGAFRVEKVLVIRAKTQPNQSARIWNCLGLPALLGLVATHRSLRTVVPLASRRSLQVMLSNQRLLDFADAAAVNRFLSAHSRPAAFLSFVVKRRV